MVRGLTDDGPGVGAASANVRVASVSRLTDGAGYASPPGVQDELQDPKSALGPTGAEFNEKALSLSWDALPAGERAEVYFRYPQQARSFLDYRQLRFWAVATRGAWGTAGHHELLVKLGTDPRNYYVYRTPLRPVQTLGSVETDHWRPEHVLEFDRFFALKAAAERSLAENGSGPITLWSEDGAYGIVLEDRARAPNLASVRELSVAVYNQGDLDTEGEVWINDMRLEAGATTPGFAGRFDVDLEAGGVVSASLSYGGRGGRFRQLEGSASLETVDELSLHTTTELGRLVPEGWGVSMPVTVSYLRTDLEPIFLRGTDVRAERLRGLRETGTTRRRIGFSLRKTTPTGNPVVSALIDGTTLRLAHVSASDATVTTESRLDGLDAGLEVDRGVADVGFGLVPSFLEQLLRWLAPAGVERSAFFERLTDARLRVTPERVGLSTSFVTQEASVWRYDRVLETPQDADVRPIRSPRRTLESGARVGLRPLQSLTASVDVITGRDLLEPGRATAQRTQRSALERARRDLAGVPLGWERDRVMAQKRRRTRIFGAGDERPAEGRGFSVDQPEGLVARRREHDIRSLIGPHQRLVRRPSELVIQPSPDGAVVELARTFNTDRRLTRGLVLDPGGALRAAVRPGGSTGEAGGEVVPRPSLPVRALLAVVEPVRPVELTWTDELASRFDRDLARPDLAFQLGLGTLDAFRSLGADTAAIALRRDAFRARSGLRLAPALSLDLGYSESRTQAFDLRAGPRAQLERSWPDVQLSWTEAPIPDWLDGVLERWSFSTGFRRTERDLRLGRIDFRRRGQVERTVPVELRVGLAGLSLSYIGSVTFTEGQDPTGLTDQTAMAHAVGVSGRFDAPAPLRTALPEPVRVSFSYDYQEQTQSRLIASLLDKADPTAFVDHINRRANLTITSLVSQIDVGLQASWVDRQSYIGKQPGSSQLQLGVFGQFNLQAGEYLRR